MVTFPSSSCLQRLTLCLVLLAFGVGAAENNSVSNITQNSAKSGTQSDRRTEKVALSTERPAIMLDGVINGYQTIDYLVDGHAGQILTISFQSSNLASYFNVIEPNAEFATFNSAMLGNSYTNKLSVNGGYTIRVYMMRNAAARNEKASYRLNLSLIE
tara:strand:+ start:64682 stop:65155 length:474 start_codon:yes stop_codon:yes gene_type:complete